MAPGEPCPALCPRPSTPDRPRPSPHPPSGGTLSPLAWAGAALRRGLALVRLGARCGSDTGNAAVRKTGPQGLCWGPTQAPPQKVTQFRGGAGPRPERAGQARGQGSRDVSRGWGEQGSQASGHGGGGAGDRAHRAGQAGGR